MASYFRSWSPLPPHWSRLVLGFALMLICGTGLVTADPTVSPRQYSDARQEQDKATVDAAEAAMATGGAGALASHIADLEDVAKRPPQGFAKLQQVGGELRYRAENLAEFTAWSIARSKARDEPAAKMVWLPDTYPTASFLLAWYYDEVRQPDKALAAADQGLALAPAEARLVAEKAQALIQLHRLEPALAIYSGGLATDGFLSDKSRALLLRGRGYCLTELNHLDEAEQAYRDSLALEPDHVSARNELTYISSLRAGGAKAPTKMLTYDKAKSGQ